MTDEERAKLLRRMEDQIKQTKNLTSEQALSRLYSEGFEVKNGTLVVLSREPNRV
jgi:hypothetical protein